MTGSHPKWFPGFRLALCSFALLCGIGFPAALTAQNNIGTGAASRLYLTHCASCHGRNLEGGLGGSLLGKNWKHFSDESGMAAYIAAGNPQMGMPAFGKALSEQEIRSLIIFLREKRAQLGTVESAAAAVASANGSAAVSGSATRPVAGGGEIDADGRSIFTGGGERFFVEDVVTGLSTPWAVAFLPDGRMLITEKRGTLRIADKDGTLSDPVQGTPQVWEHGQGGLLEVAVHPDYAQNGWVYLGYSAKSGTVNNRDVGMTKVVRGRISGGQWTDEEVLFEVPAELASPAGVHYGTRFVFQGGYLYFTMGDRGRQQQAQDLAQPNGKTHRIYDDGRVPQDNPFIDVAGAWPTIWTYGNRNAQGLAIHPLSGEIWEAEHGPRGGDEINLIRRGANYGWPLVTHGMNYDGTPITAQTEAEGIEPPRLYWVPSIAVCGIDFYTGDLFPAWRNNLFAGGLASNELHRLVIEDGQVVSDEIVLKGLGRVRDVASAPDGSLMLVLNGPDKIVRLVPAP